VIVFPQDIENRNKAKIKMPPEITHLLSLFVEHGMIADIL